MWVAPKAPAGMAEGNRESFGPRVGLSSHGSPAKGGPKSEAESGTGPKRKAGQIRYWQYGQTENSPDLGISDVSRFLSLSRFLSPLSDVIGREGSLRFLCL